MGWYYGWSSKAELVKELESEFPNGGKILEARVPNGGREHWQLVQLASGEKVILLNLLECINGSWGYKPMCEEVGPYYYRVPLKWLEQAPVKNLEWRKQVYAKWGKELPLEQLPSYVAPVAPVQEALL